MALAAASCGERVATIDPGQAEPAADLSGLGVPPGALVALPDGSVFDVGGPRASHDTRHSNLGRGSVLALDGTEWKKLADPPPFNPTIYHSSYMVRVMADDKIAVVGTECQGARVPDGIEECDDAYVQVASVLDTSSGAWSKRVEFDVPNTDDEPIVSIRATEGDEVLVHASGGIGALLWVDPTTGVARNADGFVPWQVDAICDLGDGGVVQVVNLTSIDQRTQSRVDANDPEADQKGVSAEPQQSKLDVVMSRGGKRRSASQRCPPTPR